MNGQRISIKAAEQMIIQKIATMGPGAERDTLFGWLEVLRVDWEAEFNYCVYPIDQILDGTYRKVTQTEKDWDKWIYE